MVNSLLNRLTPKEPKFFPILKQMSDIIAIASDLIIECLQSKNHEERLDYYKKIKDEERKGDKLSHKIFDELNTTFITPFDREDIHSLANMLDDVIDGINNCAKRLALYNPKQIPDSAIELARLIKESAAFIGMAIDELDILKKNATKIKKYCNELHEIENRADDVYEHFITKMFNEEKDAVEIIKLKDIMYELEKTTDSAEYVGKIIKTIIVKYA
jgi:predicted phosphate transport protein (TIGR00153 family)